MKNDEDLHFQKIAFFSRSLLKQSLKLRTMLTNTFIAPVFGLFLLGLHTRRVNSNCALVTLVIGLLFGIFVFFLHFQDSDKYLSFGIGFEDCVPFFCSQRPEFCEVHQHPDNLTLIGDVNTLKRQFYRYPFAFDLKLLRYLSYMFDGWLITLFTVSVGLVLSLFMRQPDKKPQEIEECLATYVRRSLPFEQAAAAAKAAAEPEYVHTENGEEENKSVREEGKTEGGLNQIDLSYLRKAIDEIIRLNWEGGR